LFKDKNLQPCLGQITGARQAIVSCADDNGVVRMRHGQQATAMLTGVKQFALRIGLEKRAQ
jgi:hypothetical protein